MSVQSPDSPKTLILKIPFSKTWNMTGPISDYLTAENSATTTVIVGPSEKNWLLNTRLLCDRSIFFKRAIEGGFKESYENVIRLPEADPDIFSHVVNWIYGQKLKCNGRHGADNAIGQHLMYWCKVCVLADMLCLNELAKEAIDQYKYCWKGSGWLMGPDEIEYIYKNIPKYPSLKQVIIDAYVSAIFCPEFKDMENWAKGTSQNAKFNLDVVKALKSRVVRPGSNASVLTWDLPPFSSFAYGQGW